MPFRSPKMYGFIFGFQRFVWCPKWTPASNRSFIAIALNSSLLRELTFAELEAFARSRHAVLLAFLRTRIAREQPRLAQARAQLGVVVDQRARDAQAHGACLARHAAAGRRRQHVEALRRLRDDQRLTDRQAERLGGEADFNRLLVDGDRARAGP